MEDGRLVTKFALNEIEPLMPIGDDPWKKR
jgi:hypothetical protein